MPARDLSPRDRLTRHLTSVRRALLRRRRLLAVLCTTGAVAAGLHAVAPPEPPSVEVVVATADLAGGVLLEPADLTTVALPPDTAPDGALTDPADGSGRILAAPVRAGEPVTDVRLVGAGLVDADTGAVAVPLRLSDAAQAGLLRVGDAVDLLATDPETGVATSVADGALVLAVPPVETEFQDAITGRLVVLAVPPAEVAEVTSAAVTAFVTYAWSKR